MGFSNTKAVFKNNGSF